MNILYVVPYVPNPIRVRPYQLIRSLAKLGHQVTVLTLYSGAFERDSIAQLENDLIRVAAYPLPTWRSLINCIAGLPSSDPLQSVYSWNPQLANRLVELSMPGRSPANFDIIHIEHMRGSRYGEFLLRKNPQLPIIWDSVDCISYLFQQSAQYNKKLLSRWITRFELSRSRAYESRLIRLFSRVLVTSQVDRAALLSLNSGQDKPAIDVLPNGVDLDYFRPVPHDQRDSETIVVSGKMSYHANIAMVVYMVEEIMPLVWAEKPQARLIIAGKDPPKRIRAMAADPRICVTGYIPDIRPYLQKAAIAAAPLTYGAGIQNKILEAMACATPVVTTSQGASALDASAGHDFLTAQTARDFASSLIQLMDHPDKAREIGRAGRRYVETRHDWLQKAADLLAIYCEEIDRRRNTAQPIDSESDREIRQSYNKLSTR